MNSDSQQRTNCLNFNNKAQKSHSDFQYILSRQHQKEFHIIDSPQIIFDLASIKYPTSGAKSKSKMLIENGNNHVNRNQGIEGQGPWGRMSESVNNPNQNDQFTNTYARDSEISVSNKFRNYPSINNNNCGVSAGIPSSVKKHNRNKSMNHLIGNFGVAELNGVQSKKEYSCSSASRPHYRKSSGDEMRQLKTTAKQEIPKIEMMISKKEKRITMSSFKKSLQRKKYREIKGRIDGLLQNVANQQSFSFSEVAEYQQLILKQFLNEIVEELRKECNEKGELIKLIWNSMFSLIEKIICHFQNKTDLREKLELEENIRNHQNYQKLNAQLIEKFSKTQKSVKDSKDVIDKLVKQLRFKRKQTKKLYKNVHLCNEKLNEYKSEYNQLQRQHIDLIMEKQPGMTLQEAKRLCEQKRQLHREKYAKVRVGENKRRLQKIIQDELQRENITAEEQEQLRNQLLKLNEIGEGNKNVGKKGPSEDDKKIYVQELIDNFSVRNFQFEDDLDEQSKAAGSKKSSKKTSTATNTDIKGEGMFGRPEINHKHCQTTFSDKIQYDIICTVPTQTPGNKTVIKTQNAIVQADGDKMRQIIIKSRMTTYRVLDMSFLFDLDSKSNRSKLLTFSSGKSRKRDSKRNSAQFSVDKSEGSERSKHKFINQPIIEILPASRMGSEENPVDQLQRKSSEYILNNQGGVQQKVQQKQNLLLSISKQMGGRKSKNLRNSTLNPDLSVQRKSAVQTNLQKRRTSKKHYTINSFNRTMSPSLSPSKSNFRPSITVSNCPSDLLQNENEQICQQREALINNLIKKQSDKENENCSMSPIENTKILQTFKELIFDAEMFQYPNNVNLSSNRIDEICEEEGSDSQSTNRNGRNEKEKQIQKSSEEKSGPKNSKLSKQKPKQKRKDVKSKSAKKSRKIIFSTKNADASSESNLSNLHLINKIIEFTVKKSLKGKNKNETSHSASSTMKKKQQTQHLDPLMLDIQYIVEKNSLNPNTQANKRQNKANFQKTFNRHILMTYSRSIDHLHRNGYAPDNLIRPLFESFELIYGTLKKKEIYKRMVTFIADVASMQNRNENLRTFRYFLGLDDNNRLNERLCSFDVELFLFLIEKLNMGSKLSNFELQGVYTSKDKVVKELGFLLQSKSISKTIVSGVLYRIRQKLTKFEEMVGLEAQQTKKGGVSAGHQHQNESLPLQLIKLNLFKVCKMIVEDITRVRFQCIDGFWGILFEQEKQSRFRDLANQKEGSNKDSGVGADFKKRKKQIEISQMQKLINICDISTLKKVRLQREIFLLSKNDELTGKNVISKSKLSVLFIKMGITDYDFGQLSPKMYYNNKKNNIPCNDSTSCHNSGCQNLEGFQIQQKNRLENTTNTLLYRVIGSELSLFYDFTLLKGLESQYDS